MWDDLFNEEDSERLVTPFRAHLDHCERLDSRQQLEECADYIQHIELLVSEFMESYYLVERLWEPESTLMGGDDAEGEFVLETFYESLELRVSDGDGDEGDRLVCVSGAVSTLPEDQHPALSRRGLDFVGLQGEGRDHIVLGVAQSSKDESPFLMLLRALNALAELSPPFRIVQLEREVVGSGLPENADFFLQLGLGEPDPSPDGIAIAQLTRDLAEAFVEHVGKVRQATDMLGEIACVELGPEALDARHLKRLWRVAS